MTGGRGMQRLRGRGRHEQGFTLIELLVVVLILGVLAGVAVFAVSDLGDDARDAAERTDAQTLRRAQETYFSKYGRYATEDELVAGGFLREPSVLNDIDLVDARYTIVPPLASALPLDEQVLTVGVLGDSMATNKMDRDRIGLHPLHAHVADTLVRMDNDFTMRPALAERWELAGTNTWRFHLRKDVTFHDGTPLTAVDVQYTIDRLVAKGYALTGHLGSGSAVVVDDHTIDLTPTLPNKRLPEALTHPYFGVIKNGTEPGTDPPELVATGPFVFREYVPNKHLIVERNPDYWGAKARLQQVKFVFVADAATRRLALEEGSIDLMVDLPRQQVADLKARRGFRVSTTRPGTVFMAALNVVGSNVGGVPYDLLTDVRVRRALALALDREALVNQLYLGFLAEVVQTVNPPSVLGKHAALVKGFSRDVERAEQLLVEAGFTTVGADGVRVRADGRPLSLTLMAAPAVDTQALELLQAHARQVGFEIVFDRAPNVTKNANGQWDMIAFTPNQNDANPAFLLGLWWYSKSAVPQAKYTRAPGTRFDELYQQAIATSDLDQARRFAAEAMRELIDVQAAAIPFAGLSRVYGLQAGVQGFDPPHPAQAHQPWSRVFRTQ